MNVTLRIKRYQPERDEASRFEDFEVEVEPSDRVLDTLIFIKRNLDGTLAFRKSCAHGVCGSDGMTINGVERLACKTLIQDVTNTEHSLITIEPLQTLPVQRDLMVDYSRFFEMYRVVKPYLIPKAKPDHGEFIQSPPQRSTIDNSTNCILCACCYSSCPVIMSKDPDFIGPAAVLQGARFVFDSRDMGIAPRMKILDDPHGVWPCENHMNCTRVCPRGIKVTKHINLIKRQIKTFKEPNY